MRILSILPFLFFSQNLFAKIDSKFETCTPSKEFITTMNYLKEKKEFSLNQNDAVSTAKEVAKGCRYSGKRFINALDLLLKINLATSDAIKVAKQVANSDEVKSEAFNDVLKRSFTKKYLDLPLKDAVHYAMELSINFKGSPAMAHADFKKLVDFCKDDDYLEMPLGKCAEMSLKVSKLTTRYSQSLSKSYITLFEFLNDKEGPNLPTYQALSIANELIEYGPTVAQSFKTAYEYASNEKSGLALDRTKAINFAKDLSKYSSREKEEKSKN